MILNGANVIDLERQGDVFVLCMNDGENRFNKESIAAWNMALDEVAPGFRVTAKCPDGVIEAIESEMMDWFAIGTQFHPECGAASALDIRIFEEFIEGVQQRIEQDLRLVA